MGSRSPSTNYHHVVGKLFLTSSFVQESVDDTFHHFSVDDSITYENFLDDFGPMNLASVFDFCCIVENELHKTAGPIALKTSATDRKKFTNHVFLLGSFLIMKHNFSVQKSLENLRSIFTAVLTYRDVSQGPQDFHLYVQDCWEGLVRAKDLKWVDFQNFGGFDRERYLQWDSPFSADLHEIVPGKLFALRGPVELSGDVWSDISSSDGKSAHRVFSPAYYSTILKDFGVQAVVRLNDPHYSSEPFRNAGIAVADLPFPEGTNPPVDVVASFFAIADALPGPVAVHCTAGLGRTGTLIALYLMRRYGFSARAALGWLRIVRPGSVIGPQQHFVCERESRMLLGGRQLPQLTPPAKSAPSDLKSVERFIEDVVLRYRVRQAAACLSIEARLREARNAPAGEGNGMPRSHSAEELLVSPSDLGPTKAVAGSSRCHRKMRQWCSSEAVTTAPPAALHTGEDRRQSSRTVEMPRSHSAKELSMRAKTENCEHDYAHF